MYIHVNELPVCGCQGQPLLRASPAKSVRRRESNFSRRKQQTRCHRYLCSLLRTLHPRSCTRWFEQQTVSQTFKQQTAGGGRQHSRSLPGAASCF